MIDLKKQNRVTVANVSWRYETRRRGSTFFAIAKATYSDAFTTFSLYEVKNTINVLEDCAVLLPKMAVPSGGGGFNAVAKISVLENPSTATELIYELKLLNKIKPRLINFESPIKKILTGTEPVEVVTTSPSIFPSLFNVTAFAYKLSEKPDNSPDFDILVFTSPGTAPKIAYATEDAAELLYQKAKEKEECKICNGFIGVIPKPCPKFELLEPKIGGLANKNALRKLCDNLTYEEVNNVLDYLLVMNPLTLVEFGNYVRKNSTILYIGHPSLGSWHTKQQN